MDSERDNETLEINTSKNNNIKIGGSYDSLYFRENYTFYNEGDD